MKLPLWVSALSATLLVQIVSAFAAAALPLLGPVLTQRWSLPPESIGYVSATVSVGICWCLACGGPMLDHHGPVRTLQIGLGAICLGIMVLALPAAAFGFVGALLLGLGLAPNNPAGSTMLMRTAPFGHRNLIFSIRQAGVPLGGAIAGVSVAPAVSGLGLTKTVWVIVAIVMLSLLAVQPFRKWLDTDRVTADRRWAWTFLSPSVLRSSAMVIRSHPSLPLLTTIGVAFSVAQACVQAFTATYLVTQLGKDLAEAGHIVAVLFVASTLSRIILGWLADRWRRGLLLLSLLLLAAGSALAMLVWSAAGPQWLFYCSIACVGATSLGWTGVYMAELARLSPPSLIGDITSAASLIGFVGACVGPLVFALLASRTGSFGWPFLLVAAQLFGFGICSLRSFSPRKD